MGHISIGAMQVDETGRQIKELSKERLDALLHVILSHHGEQEKGSPVACSTKEAFIVHYADEADAIMNQYQNMKDKSWEYNKMMQRYLYKG